MKAFLMYRDRDFELNAGVLPNAAEIVQDLELDTLFNAMAAGDKFLLEVAQSAVLASLHEPETILYRQQVLADCFARPEIVREIYALAVEAIDREKKIWGWMSARYPEGTLHRCVDVLRMFAELFRRLRGIADGHAAAFCSEGFRRFFGMITEELNDEYLQTVDEHLQRLEFSNGVLMSAALGPDCKGADYVLRKAEEPKQNWLDRLQTWAGQLAGKNGASVYEVDQRDEAGLRILGDLRVQGIVRVATALAQSTDHILSFFKMLRLELAFYIGCMNLHERMAQKQEPVCFPGLLPAERADLTCRGLYDICLSLNVAERVVGNDVAAEGRELIVITGANRGGKSTLLRSFGLAQLMMQCGMFVPALEFRASLCLGIFTHFKREEDAAMRSGKLDEELARMSAIVERIVPGSLILLNESFASTNEREGSEIARQIVHALLEAKVKVVYVTHMFDLAEGFYREQRSGALFLRAERLEDGRRTFHLPEGQPLPTSFGEDLYRRIFE